MISRVSSSYTNYHLDILTISYDKSTGAANLITISTSLLETLVTFHPTIVLFPEDSMFYLTLISITSSSIALVLAILSENLSVTYPYLDISFSLTLNSVVIGFVTFIVFLVGTALGFPKIGYIARGSSYSGV
jgi:hypothetical protein